MKILRRAYRPEGPCPLSPVLGKPPTLPLGPRWAIKPKERFEYRMSLVSLTLPIIGWVKGSCKRGGNINKKLHQLILQISFHHNSSPGSVDRVTSAAGGRAEFKGQAEDQWCIYRGGLDGEALGGVFQEVSRDCLIKLGPISLLLD